MAGVAAGIKLIGQSLTEVSSAIQDCKGAAEDVEELLATLKQFKTPEQFAYHVGKDLIVSVKHTHTHTSTSGLFAAVPTFSSTL